MRVVQLERLESRTLLSTTLNWTVGPPNPVGRAEGSRAVVNNKLYTVGGFFDGELHVSKELDVYDPATNKWTRLADMPVPETHGATAVIGTQIWFAGFFFNDGITASKLVYMYDTATKSWTQEPSLPAGRGAAGAAILGHTLHVWGGLTGETTSASNHWALDLNNLSAGWKTLAPLPERLDHMASLAYNGELWSIGGFVDKNELTGNENAVYRYDLAADSWSKAGIAQLPQGLGHIGPDTTLAGDKIIIAGGEANSNNRDELSQVLEYDPSQNRWLALTPMPGQRMSAFVGFVGGKLVVSCGNQPTAPYATAETFIANFNPGNTVGIASGMIFNDRNQNGKRDSGDLGLPGITVYADSNNNGKLDSGEVLTTTDKNGNFAITLPIGPTILRQILPSGWKQISPTKGFGQHITIVATPMGNENFADAGSAVVVSGVVFNDANGDGNRNSNEVGLTGWTVYLDMNNNGMLDSTEETQTTDSNGAFSFTDLPGGAYIFRVIRPAGWSQTFPTKNFGQHVTISAGGIKTDLRFGEKQG